MQNKKGHFDELDMKVIRELPLIAEVLSATVNKMVRLFTSIYENMLEVCQANMPQGWELHKKQVANVLYPFSSAQSRDKTTQLENYFQLENLINFVVKQGEKTINILEIEFGFYYDESWEISTPYFYFIIHKIPPSRIYRDLYPLSYYQQVVKQYPDYLINIYHPGKGNESESLELQIDADSISLVAPAAEIFATEILTDFLKGINGKTELDDN